MKKSNVKSVILGAVASMTANPLTALASNNVSDSLLQTSEDNTLIKSSNSRAITSLNKEGIVQKVKEGDTLTVREGTNTSYNAIGYLPNNSRVHVTGRDSETGWYKINYNGKDGYVSDYYLNVIDLTGKLKVTNEALNLRQTESWSATSLAVIPKGSTVEVISNNNGWAKVKYIDKIGYCSESYLTSLTNSVSINSTSKVTTEALNLRKTASWSADIILTIPKGASVKVISDNGSWALIEYKSSTGYVSSTYLTNSNNSNSSTTTNDTTTDAVNLRDSASWSANIITVVPKGASVKTNSSWNGWSDIEYNKQRGYVPTKYLASNSQNSSNNNGNSTNNNGNSSNNTTSNIESMNKTGKIVKIASNDTLNVRNTPNSEGSIIGQLSLNNTVQITGQDKDTKWYQINYNGKVGYINSYYVELINTSTQTSTYKKTTANLNMRTGPNTSNSIILQIPKNTSVKVVSSSNGWDKVEYAGYTGYCSSSYLVATNETPTVKKVTTTNVNMRTGAGTSYAIIKTLDTNTVVDVVSESNGWSKIIVNGQTGYMNSKYLKLYEPSDETSSGSSTGNISSKPLYKKVKVAIDPGHGGTDPGAIGNGIREKDVVLSISKKVNNKLQNLGFQTKMTRSTDVFISLSQRYSIANNYGADMFVSIHANSASASAYGIETLYKSSKSFAQSLQNGMINATGANSRGLKYRTDLAVLNGGKMPTALVEVGFISNSSEASKLSSDAYQEKIANGIVAGIVNYTDENISK